MMNDFSKIDDSEIGYLATVTPEELPEFDSANEHELEYNDWPGDGSGEDDLADFNQNEVDDYRDENSGDTNDIEYDTPLGEEYGGE